MLSTFERCPLQYRHKYVSKIKGVEPCGIDLICGNAAHVVLQGILDVYRRTGSHPDGLVERIENALTSSRYPQDGPWSTDVERVATWVEIALSGIPGTARVAQVER